MPARTLSTLSEHPVDLEEFGNIKPKPLNAKNAGLRIDTSSAAQWSLPLKERTNSVRTSNSRQVMTPHGPPSAFPSALPPNTSFTFGIPDVTSVVTPPAHFTSLDPPSASMSLVQPDSAGLHRRYKEAEATLHAQLARRTPERSPQELQIVALERATALLAAHAQDAQERAAHLRASLKDPDATSSGLKLQETLDPSEKVSREKLLRDRWMEEHRVAAADRQARLVREQLASLSKSVVSRPPSPEAESSPRSGNDEARRRANLATFFARSPTKAPIVPVRSNAPATLHLSSRLCVDTRRMTLQDVTPLRLLERKSPIVPPFAHHLRSQSEGLQLHTRGRQQSNPGQTLLPGSRGVLTVVPEDKVREVSLAPPAKSPVSSSGPSAVLERPPASGVLTPPSAASHTTSFPLDADDAPGVSGSVTIFTPRQRRSRAEILAQLESAPLPSYAQVLMERLEYVSHDVNRITAPVGTSTLSTMRDTPTSGRETPKKPSPLTQLTAPPPPDTPRKKRWAVLKKKPPQRAAQAHKHAESLVSVPESPQSAQLSFVRAPSRPISTVSPRSPAFTQASGEERAASPQDLEHGRGMTTKLKRGLSRLGMR